MRNIIIGLSVLIFFGCAGDAPVKQASPVVPKKIERVKPVPVPLPVVKKLADFQLSTDKDRDYTSIKKDIESVRKSLRDNKIPLDSVSAVFTRSLLNRIIPHWEGTQWGSDGESLIPTKGEISSGFFVSTTLEDIGMRLDERRFERNYPIHKAKYLAAGSKIIEVAQNSVERKMSRINKTVKDGIHFIGFNHSHAGFLLKENGELYLIHSNYIEFNGVEIKKVEDSEVFAAFSKFFIAELSTNEGVLRNWLNEIEPKFADK